MKKENAFRKIFGKYLNKLEELGEPYIFGDNAGLHDSITSENGSFAKILGRIRNERNATVNIILHKENIKRLIDILFFLKGLDVEKTRMLFPENVKGSEKDYSELAPSINEAAPYIDDALNFGNFLGIDISPNTISYDYLKPAKLLEIPTNLKPAIEIDKGHSEKKVSIIIITKDKEKYLKKTLQALFKQKYPLEEIESIVVDDGSKKDSAGMINSMNPPCSLKYVYWPRLVLYESGKPVNRAGPARNLGAQFSRGEFLIFLDDDIITEPDFIQQHLRSHTGRDLVIGRTMREKEKQDIRDAHFRAYDNDLSKYPIPWWLVNAGNFSVSKDDFLRVGGFDDDFVFWSIEDEELGYKMEKSGISIKLNAKATGLHQTHLSDYVSPEQRNFGINYNAEIFYKKHLDIDIYNRFFGLSISSNPSLSKSRSRKKNPLFEQIRITEKCNNNCVYCRIERNKNFEMGISKIKSELENTKRKGKWAQLKGGEVPLIADFDEVLHFIKEREIDCELASNGRIFSYPDFCLKVILNRINNFRISVQGHTPEIHDKGTGIKGSFWQTVKGINNLLSIGAAVLVDVKITPLNYLFVLEILEYYEKLGINKFSLDIILGFNNMFRETGIEFLENLKHVIKKKNREVEKLTITATDDDFSYIKNLIANERISKTFLRDTHVFSEIFMKLNELNLLPKIVKYKGNGILLECYKNRPTGNDVLNLKMCERCRFFLICKGRILPKNQDEKTIFFRDDDIWEATPKLKRLVDIFINEGTPINLQVVPGKLTDDTARWLLELKNRHPKLIELNQHGWIHNNFGSLEKPYEFGKRRKQEEQYKDISAGKDKMSRHFGKYFSQVFTPPYHGYDGKTIKVLEELGFKAVSKFDDRKSVGNSLKEISPSVDLFRYEKTKAIPKSLGEITREFSEKLLASDNGNIGILIHHEELDDKMFEYLKILINHMKFSGFSFKSFSDILGVKNEN